MQGDLFPFGPETVLAMCRRIEARILAHAPELARRDLETIYGGLCGTDLAINEIAARITGGTDWQRRQQLDAVQLTPAPRSPWRAPRDRIVYTPLARAVGKEAPVRPTEGWYQAPRARRSHYHAGSSRALCGKAFVPTLIPEQLTETVDPQAVPCADCARMAEARDAALSTATGAVFRGGRR